MNPTRVYAENFRTYEQLDVALPEGCVAILGDNGCGKSSLVSIVDLCLFGAQSRSLADYLSDTAAGDLLLELQFDHAGETYRVRRTYSARGRGKTTVDFEALSVDGWTPLTGESAAATQAAIEKTIGLSRETFYASSFLVQGHGGRDFTEAQPRDRKRILAEVLGLDRWDVLRDRNRVELRHLERQLNEAAGRVGAARDLAATKADVLVAHADAHAAELDHADTLADSERVHQELGQRWQQAREQAARRQAAEAELAAARDQLERLQRLDRAADEAALARGVTTDELIGLPQPTEQGRLEQRIEDLAKAVADHADAQRAHDQAVVDLQRAERERATLMSRADDDGRRVDDLREKARELEAAPDPTCQTCGQSLPDEARSRAISSYLTEASIHANAAHEARVAAEAIAVPVVPAAPEGEPPVRELETVRMQLRSVTEAAAQRARLEERLVALQVTVNARPAQPQLADALRVCDEKLHALDELGEAVSVADLEQEGLAAKRAVDQAKVAFDAARTQRTRLEERLAQITAAEEQIAAAEIEGAKVAREIEVVAQLDRAFSPDGIPALIVENGAIPYLETEASRILADLGTSFRVELRTQAALKSGDGVRDTLDVVIQTQESERPYETFSGGERTRLNLALRIALARLLAHRRGAESRLLCIDEPEFLDEQGTSALVDVLRCLQDDFDRVYLISHVPALRDSFDEVLTVVKGDDGVSRVDEQAVFEPVPA